MLILPPCSTTIRFTTDTPPPPTPKERHRDVCVCSLRDLKIAFLKFVPIDSWRNLLRGCLSWPRRCLHRCAWTREERAVQNEWIGKWEKGFLPGQLETAETNCFEFELKAAGIEVFPVMVRSNKCVKCATNKPLASAGKIKTKVDK